MTSSFDRNQWFNSALRLVLVQVGRCYATEKKLTEDLLISLHSLFPNYAVAALDLLDHKSVSLAISPSNRRIYSCIGSSGTPYLISHTGFSCTCFNYRSSISCENMWCKHLLALQLAIAMDQVQLKEVNEDVMNSMLSELGMIE